MIDNPGEKTPELADNSLLKQPGPGRGPGRPFQKGQSGNPAGRPPGSRNKLRAMIEEVLEQELPHLMNQLLQLAHDGNMQALKLLFAQLPRERETVEVDLPPITSMAEIGAANEAIFAAIATGALSLESGQRLAQLLEFQMKMIESISLEQRVAAIELQQAETSKRGGKK
jgi:thioredoxin-like negative regulator of GroEL